MITDDLGRALKGFNRAEIARDVLLVLCGLPEMLNVTPEEAAKGAFAITDAFLAQAAQGETEAPAAAEDNGWIEWGGGGLPVAADARVMVRYRDGIEDGHQTASHYAWYHDCAKDDIVAYRVLK